MDHRRLLRDARLARREIGSEYRILSKYERSCAEMVENISNLDLNIEQIGDVGKTWLWSFEEENNGYKQRKLLNFWRELTDILCALILKELAT